MTRSRRQKYFKSRWYLSWLVKGNQQSAWWRRRRIFQEKKWQLQIWNSEIRRGAHVFAGNCTCTLSGSWIWGMQQMRGAENCGLFHTLWGALEGRVGAPLGKVLEAGRPAEQQLTCWLRRGTSMPWESRQGTEAPGPTGSRDWGLQKKSAGMGFSSQVWRKKKECQRKQMKQNKGLPLGPIPQRWWMTKRQWEKACFDFSNQENGF